MKVKLALKDELLITAALMEDAGALNLDTPRAERPQLSEREPPRADRAALQGGAPPRDRSGSRDLGMVEVSTVGEQLLERVSTRRAREEQKVARLGARRRDSGRNNTVIYVPSGTNGTPVITQAGKP